MWSEQRYNKFISLYLVNTYLKIFAQSVVRVFLEDNSMKTLPVVLPCEVKVLTDSMKKKLLHIDTTNYAIFEYSDNTGD